MKRDNGKSGASRSDGDGVSRIRFIVDRLPVGCVFPCTATQIKEKLRKLPAEDLDGIHRVRLSAQKWDCVDASYNNGTIMIYAVPADLKFSYPRHPGDRFMQECARYGARWQKLGGEWYCYWDRESYRRYILDHVLLHEIGHHLDEFHRRRTSEGVERFAERYAITMEGQCG